MELVVSDLLLPKPEVPGKKVAFFCCYSPPCFFSLCTRKRKSLNFQKINPKGRAAQKFLAQQFNGINLITIQVWHGKIKSALQLFFVLLLIMTSFYSSFPKTEVFSSISILEGQNHQNPMDPEIQMGNDVNYPFKQYYSIVSSPFPKQKCYSHIKYFYLVLPLSAH